MRLILSLLLLCSLSLGAQAAPGGNVASLCKDQWPGNRGMQSYCIKEKMNYYDWLQYIRKRVFSQPPLLQVMDGCIAKYEPDYRRAIDCYWDEVGE